MVSCVLSPYLLAFNSRDVRNNAYYADQFINAFFILDIFLNFFSAYYTEDMEIVDNRRVSTMINASFFTQKIIRVYLKGWFIFDLISIIPFEMVFTSGGGVNRLTRFLRIGKVYKIIRMLKMVRLIKMAKVQNQLMKNLQEILKIGVGMERLFFLLMIFLLFVHIISCLW